MVNAAQENNPEWIRKALRAFFGSIGLDATDLRVVKEGEKISFQGTAEKAEKAD